MHRARQEVWRVNDSRAECSSPTRRISSNKPSFSIVSSRLYLVPRQQRDGRDGPNGDYTHVFLDSGTPFVATRPLDQLVPLTTQFQTVGHTRSHRIILALIMSRRRLGVCAGRYRYFHTAAANTGISTLWIHTTPFSFIAPLLPCPSIPTTVPLIMPLTALPNSPCSPIDPRLGQSGQWQTERHKPRHKRRGRRARRGRSRVDPFCPRRLICMALDR